MRWNTTLALLLATVGIGAYISLHELRQPTPEQRARLSKRVVNLEPASVTQLVLDLPQAKVTLSREGKAWQLLPAHVRADVDRIDRLLEYVSPLSADRTLEGSSDHPLDPKAYGVDPGLGTLALTANGATTTLIFGEETPIQGSRYLKLPERPQIYVVPASLFVEANQPAESFRDPKLIRFETWSANSLSVNAAGTSFALERQENDWRLTQPVMDSADRTEVANLLSRLSTLMIKRFVNDAPTVEQLPQWGFDQPKAELTLIRQDGSTTIFFGKPLEQDASLLYAKRNDEAPIYAVASSDVDALLGDPMRLRAKPAPPPSPPPSSPGPTPKQ